LVCRTEGDFYQKHPNDAFTQIVEPGDGHFSASKEKIALIDLFLRKAAQYRLPADSPAQGPVRLTPIDAGSTGWLYEVWHLDAPPSVPAAPVSQFKAKEIAPFGPLMKRWLRRSNPFKAVFAGNLRC